MTSDGVNSKLAKATWRCGCHPWARRGAILHPLRPRRLHQRLLVGQDFSSPITTALVVL